MNSIDDDIRKYEQEMSTRRGQFHEYRMRRFLIKKARIDARREILVSRRGNTEFFWGKVLAFCIATVFTFFGAWIYIDANAPQNTELEKLEMQQEQQFRLKCLDKEWVFDTDSDTCYPPED